MRSTLAVFAVLLAACSAEDPPTFRDRDAAWWSSAIDDATRRKEAMKELADGGEDALPVLRALLSGDAPLSALAAADALGKLGPRAAEAVPDLIDALEDVRLRGLVATVLGRIGPKAREALPALRDLDSDPDERVRIAGAFACWQIAGQADALRGLVAGLESGTPAVRRMAVGSLAAVGKPAVNALIGALSNSDARVRASAADAIGNIGTDAATARKALYDALKDESVIVRSAADAALKKLRER